MKTYTFPASIEGGFNVIIDYRIASDGEVIEVGVSSAASGEDLTQLVAFTSIMQPVYTLAEAHALTQLGD
jgi:hypothetical protein